eukprot:scaffold276458_cov30-Tisochrysis_lutea.AAC.1
MARCGMPTPAACGGDSRCWPRAFLLTGAVMLARPGGRCARPHRRPDRPQTDRRRRHARARALRRGAPRPSRCSRQQPGGTAAQKPRHCPA